MKPDVGAPVPYAAPPFPTTPQFVSHRSRATYPPRPSHSSQQPFNHAGVPQTDSPYHSRSTPYSNIIASQDSYLNGLLEEHLPQVIATEDEIRDRYAFLATIESAANVDFLKKFSSPSKFHLVPYGSIESGFATKGSDVDAVVVWETTRQAPTPEELAELPRLLEKTILNNNWGARLLAHTRVPVLKVCARPSQELLQALREERQKWEAAGESDGQAEKEKSGEALSMNHSTITNDSQPSDSIKDSSILGSTSQKPDEAAESQPGIVASVSKVLDTSSKKTSQSGEHEEENVAKEPSTSQSSPSSTRRWRRERPSGPLDFPANTAPLIDVNFSTELGILNTKLLRCYSWCDRRVLEMVHFVKSWAKCNKIASAYNGSLCSYGWVLMVLHYLVNIVQPPVLPNLQQDYPHVPLTINNEDVGFFDNPMELVNRRERGMLFGGKPLNTQHTSSLLRGFFHYYAHQGPRVIGGGFRWREDIISLRIPGGLVTKASKGWTSSASTTVNGVEVKQRYLLAIECPIEVGHNVARTVVHYGIVGMRDELRRTWTVLEGIGRGRFPDPGKGLFDYQYEELEKNTPNAAETMQKNEEG
jgi:terminal uridylyltransferase